MQRPVVPAERRRLILETLREHGSVSVGAVKERFGVSPMTARRDLATLAERGYARRTHGGAMLPELASHEDSFQSRMEQDVAGKTRLGKAVAALVEPDETVFVDSSSSAYYFVRELLALGTPVTLLTNSLPLIAMIGGLDAAPVELIAVGGSFRPLTRSFVGAETVRMIERYLVDRLVFSVKGIELGGFLTEPDPLEADVKRAMIERARTAVLLAGADKFDQRGLNLIVSAEAVDLAFLADAPIAGVRALQRAGVDTRCV